MISATPDRLVSGFVSPRIDPVRLLPGSYKVVTDDSWLYTVLGSCVSVCLRDKDSGIGGMNHFLLPGEELSHSGNFDSESARYGINAIELLINQLLRAGGHRKNLEAKVFGGARIHARMANIGQRNIDFVMSFMKQDGISVTATDLGGNQPRKLLFCPLTGVARVLQLPAIEAGYVANHESSYMSYIKHLKTEPRTELFGD